MKIKVKEQIVSVRILATLSIFLLCCAFGMTGVLAAEQNNSSGQTQPSVVYRAHVQNIGTQSDVSDGDLIGTTDSGFRVEALWINLKNVLNGGISYSTHVQGIGWQREVSAGTMSGTTGQSRRVEAVKIHLTGAIASQYDIAYRAYVQDIGWLGWAKNGAPAGTSGRSLQIEGLQIKLVAKGATPTNDPVDDASVFSKPYLTHFIDAQTHVQRIGWQDWQQDRQIVGTTGRGLRLEAIRLKLANVSGLEYSGGIIYRTHVQRIGWQGWRANGADSGTTGRGLRLEAIQIKLTGEIARHYDIYYRVHVQHYGWLDWAKNGESAGTSSLAYRMEALQIMIEPKDAAPGDTYQTFISNRRDKLVALARTQLGYHEGIKNGKSNNHTKYGEWYSRTVARNNIYAYSPWCAMFASWVGNQMGLPNKTWYYHAYTPSGVAEYQRRGKWHWKRSYSPKTGDLIYYDWVSNSTGRGNNVVDHVGIVESNKNGEITTIEGNYRDQVKRRILDKNDPSDMADVFGYASPSY